MIPRSCSGARDGRGSPDRVASPNLAMNCMPSLLSSPDTVAPAVDLDTERLFRRAAHTRWRSRSGLDACDREGTRGGGPHCAFALADKPPARKHLEWKGQSADARGPTPGRLLHHVSDRAHNRTCFRIGTRLADRWSADSLGADGASRRGSRSACGRAACTSGLLLAARIQGRQSGIEDACWGMSAEADDRDCPAPREDRRCRG